MWKCERDGLFLLLLPLVLLLLLLLLQGDDGDDGTDNDAPARGVSVRVSIPRIVTSPTVGTLNDAFGPPTNSIRLPLAAVT